MKCCQFQKNKTYCWISAWDEPSRAPERDGFKLWVRSGLAGTSYQIPSGMLISTWVSCCCPEEDTNSCTCCTPHLTPALSRAEQISYMKMGSAWRHWPLRSCWQHCYVKLVFGSRATEPSAGALQKSWCCMHHLGTTKPVHLLWRHKWPWDMLADNMLCECSHSKTRAGAAHSSTSVSSQ